MKFTLLVCVTVSVAAVVTAVKIGSSQAYNVLHPQAAQSLYNPFVKATYPEFQSTNTYFG